MVTGAGQGAHTHTFRACPAPPHARTAREVMSSSSRWVAHSFSGERHGTATWISVCVEDAQRSACQAGVSHKSSTNGRSIESDPPGGGVLGVWMERD